jgi:hypothetical protein
MSNVKQQAKSKTLYKVALPFIHEHVSQVVGTDIALSERQAQHLLLAGFIVVPDATDGLAIVSTKPGVVKKGGA